jgi:anti-sigma factor RsiW
MSEHNAFLRLAATAVDFQLDPHEARALGQHLQGCDECRHTAGSLRGDAAALRSLPRRSPPPRIAAAIARAARGEARTTRSPLLLLGLGFLLVAGLAGAVIGGQAIRQALESDGPAPTPGLTEPAIVVPSPLPSGTTEPSASPDPRLGVEWQLVTPDGLSHAVQAVTAGGPGFVAVGRPADGGCETPTDQSEPEQCWGGAWISSDGVIWQEAPRQASLEIGAGFPLSGPGSDMIGVAADPDTIVAMGYAMAGAPTTDAGGRLGPAVWTSTDGLRWERVADESMFERARFSDVAATEEGFVIVGAVYGVEQPLEGEPRGAVWTSVDGREWQRVPDGPIFDIGGYQDTGEDPASGGPRRVTAAGGGITAVGLVCDDQGLDCVTAFWSSPDGSAWERVVLEEPNVEAGDIAATADGFVAVGIESNLGGCGVDLPCTAAVLTSADGRVWRRRQVEVPEGMIAPDYFSDVVVVGGRIIAISNEQEPDGLAESEAPAADALWSSTDGRLWTPLGGVAADFLRAADWQPIASGPARVAIIGQVRFDPEQVQVLISPPR